MPHNGQITSRAIERLRFPLAALVVICHCKLLYGIRFGGETLFPAAGINLVVQIFLSEVLPHVAVPMFALISGYLFFRTSGEFSRDVYLRKLRRRIHTLLLPYIIWCTFAYVVMCIRGETDFSVTGWLQGLWNRELWSDGTGALTAFGNFPADMPLWFVRDLIVAVFLSPVVYLLIKKAGFAPVVMAGIWWYVNVAAHVTGFSSVILFFFSLGAYLSVKRVDLATLCLKYRYPLYLSAIILAAADFAVLVRGYEAGAGLKYNWWIFNAYTFAGVFALFAACASLLRRVEARGAEPQDSRLSRTSFFIFAAHALFYPQLLSWLYGIMRPESDAAFLLFYLSGFTVVILLCVTAYFALNALSPTLCGILCGNRTKKIINHDIKQPLNNH